MVQNKKERYGLTTTLFLLEYLKLFYCKIENTAFKAMATPSTNTILAIHE